MKKKYEKKEPKVWEVSYLDWRGNKKTKIIYAYTEEEAKERANEEYIVSCTDVLNSLKIMGFTF